MAVKKPMVKKPVTAMKKTSPMKQQKPRVDDAEMKAYIKAQGAAKDKRVAAHKQGLLDNDKKGYTNDQINLYKNIAGRGEYSMGGAKVNFRTGESEITKFDKKYQAGSNKGVRDRVLTADGKKEISKSGMQGGRTDAFPSGEYLNQKLASRMGDRDFRKQYVNDSINTQERKEIHKNIGENYGRVGRLYGLQDSQIGANIKAAIKKASKKSPAKQFIDPEAKKREQEKRKKMTANERKMEGTSMAKGPNRESVATTRKKFISDLPSASRKNRATPVRQTSDIRKKFISDVPSAGRKTTKGTVGRPTRATPVKMKKC